MVNEEQALVLSCCYALYDASPIWTWLKYENHYLIS